MKKVFISIFMSISLFQIYSKERINRTNLFFDKSSETLWRANGWCYNSTFGTWINHKNVISSARTYFPSKSSHENFRYIKTKTFFYKGKTYYILIIERWRGYYKYQYIKQGWTVYLERIGYIYTKKEYRKLLDIESESIIELKTKRIASISVITLYYNETRFLNAIQEELSNNNEYGTEYIFPIMKSKEGTIRFHLPKPNISIFERDFKNEYFETDIKSFKKIIVELD